jgi:NADH-dependent peroxiredoxin subunit F
MHDVIVIGAGPAGLAATAYALHHHLNTLVIAPDLAGKAAYRLQLPWHTEREYINGEETVAELRQRMLVSPNIKRYLDRVEQVFIHDNSFQVITAEGDAARGRTMIVASGVRARALGVPGEQRLLGYGVSYSATSHAALFAKRSVVVVGSDLRALRAVADLLPIAAHVTLIAPNPAALQAHPLGQRLIQTQRIAALGGWRVAEIIGEHYTSGVIAVAPDGQTQTIPAEGVFIEHELEAPTDFLGTLVARSESGHILVDEYGATSCAGLFAAGDITNYAHAEQILIALGAGTKASLSAIAYLREKPGWLLEQAYTPGYSAEQQQ